MPLKFLPLADHCDDCYRNRGKPLFEGQHLCNEWRECTDSYEVGNSRSENDHFETCPIPYQEVFDE
jgi:hypothetical protein